MPGEIAYLAAISPAVHRLALELIARLAAALAQAICDTSAIPPEIAGLRGDRADRPRSKASI